MKKLLYLFLFISFNSNAQNNSEFEKLFQTNFIQLNNVLSYPNLVNKNVQYDSSLTKKGDTTGMHNEREYLMFHDAIVTENKTEVLKLLHTSWVSNAEYDAFTEWVLDSILRVAIYENGNITGKDPFTEKELAKLLFNKPPKKKTNDKDSVSRAFPAYTPGLPVHFFDYDFNWRKKLNPKAYIPVMAMYRLRPHERFYQRNDFDIRKWIYRAPNETCVLASRDREIWAKASQHPFDYSYNLANHYYRAKEFSDAPVQGILGTQAQAYLFYLEAQYQKEIDRKKLPYTIRLTLPQQSDLTEAFANYQAKRESLEIAETNMTKHWQITNSDYAKFIAAVRDSLIREAIYENSSPTPELIIAQEKIAYFLEHPKTYFDDVVYEWTIFEPVDAYINRELFFFDYDYNWAKKIDKEKYLPLINYYFGVKDLQAELDYTKFQKRKYRYRFYWQDLKRRTNVGNLVLVKEHYEPANEADLKWDTRAYILEGFRRTNSLHSTIIHESVHIYPGINCSNCNQICEHRHGYEFDTEEELQAVCDKCPGDYDNLDAPAYDFESNPNGLVQGLTYLQALAFYNWKFLNKAPQVDFEEVIYNELLPSEVEFYKIQNGETIIKAGEKIAYPTPLFRYVMHVYER